MPLLFTAWDAANRRTRWGAGGVLNAPARAYGTGPVSAAWPVNNAGVGGAAYAPDLGAGWFPFRCW